MYLGDFNQNATAAERARRRIQYQGATFAGGTLWVAWEDDLCRQYGHNYTILQEKLPHRTYFSLRKHCQALGLRPKRNLVTAGELSRIRRLVPTASPDQLREAFPSRSPEQLLQVSRYYGIWRKRRPFGRTGISIINAIRDRCFELGYSMVDLDELAKTKGYFARSGWSKSRRPNYRAVGLAVAALDGELQARWRDE